MTPIRVALIGCGFFAGNHMRGWAEVPGAKVVGVCDIDPAKAHAFADAHGVARVYTDAATMLTALAPDVCDIATTVGSHRMLVELAARHARMVICQKPFAETIRDARAMVAACQATGTTLMVHENFRWQKPCRTIGRMIAEGAIGRPRFLRLSFRHAYDIYANQPYLAEVPDLALTDIGLHLFDMARMLAGDIDAVFCRTQRRNPRVKGQDAFLALLEQGDCATSVECSFHSIFAPDPFPQTLALVEGAQGTLELQQDGRLILHRAEGAQVFDTDPPVPDWGARPWHLVQDSVLAFQAHAARVLAGQEEPQPSGAHNLMTLAAVLAAIRSSQTGLRVPVADMLERPE